MDNEYLYEDELPEVQYGEDGDVELLRKEMASRELARRSFRHYLYYVHGAQWKRTRMSDFLADKVQEFVETDTGNAFDILVIETSPQHGKLCANSTPVPTPSGWKTHGELRTGDYVFSPEGRPIRVLAEIPQTEPASMLVTFSDGAQVRVHPRHEWTVWSTRRGLGHRHEQVTLETQEMLRKGLHVGPNGRRGRYVYSVAANVCVDYPTADLPVDPYVFGLWLGDGTTTRAAITHHPADTETIAECARRGYVVSSEQTHKTTGCVLTNFYRGPLLPGLRSLGLGYPGCRSKYLPNSYRIADKRQRLELLAGVIDSDGYVYQNNGRVTISNVNRELIDGLAEVVRSLGWVATISAAKPVTSTSGIAGKQVCYQLTFNPDCDIPTQLPRKRITRTTPCKRRRAIVRIEKCIPEPGKCITVEGGLYLVGSHFTPTHNSITITESFPSWYLGRYPRHRIIEASYNDDTAKRFGRKNIEKIEQFGSKLFGMDKGSIWTTNEFELANGWGKMISRGIMSGITGNPANLIIIDDPIKNAEESASEAYREKLWSEWQHTLKTRLAAKAKVIVIATPWSEDDLLARIIAREQNVTLIRLPVEAEENDPLGRRIGEALCPELGKDNAWLKQFKESYLNDISHGGGHRAWQALYQCSPRVEGGNLVRREWWRFFNPKDITVFGTTIISVDATFKDGKDNDYVAIEVISKLGNNYYVRYVLKRHMDFPATVQAIAMVKQLYPETRYIVIEDKANGSAIIQTLRSKYIGVISVTPKGGKVSRVNAISPAIESGNVLLPEGEPWVEEFIDEFTAFPAGAHDDCVDACSQGLGYLIFSPGIVAAPETDDAYGSRAIAAQEQERYLDGSLYDVYATPEFEVY